MNPIVIYLIIIAFITASYASAQSSAKTESLHCEGQAFPKISHVDEMKISGDTLFMVYETEGGFCQRILRRATVDVSGHRLALGPEVGKQDDGYYASYMPYPFVGADGRMTVVGQDDGEVYNIINDSVLMRPKLSLFDGDVPFPISRYAQDVYAASANQYIFVGREPKGGAQYAMRADMDSARIDTIRRLSASPTLPAWMPNAGELAYNPISKRLAFAYRLHPVVEIFGVDGAILKRVEVGDATFDPSTLDKADFEADNPQHFVDISATDGYIYALYWGRKFGETGSSTIYKIDWCGNIVKRYTIDETLSKIAVYDENILIAWDGKQMKIVSFH